MNRYRLRLPHLTTIAAICGLLALLLSACNLPAQSDPPGQNSGSPQNAQGVFNIDDPNAVTGTVGQALSVFNVFTKVMTSITVNTASVSTTPANQNAGEQILPDGEQFLLVNITIKNLAPGNSKACPGGNCTEYITPLSNFRLLDDQQRLWPSTTGAAESCNALQTDPSASDACSNRRWLNEADTGIPAGGSFSNRMAFLIPANGHSFTLYFAPYRYSDTTTDNGSPAGTTPSAGTVTPAAKTTVTPVPTAGAGTTSNQPTLAKITISV